MRFMSKSPYQNGKDGEHKKMLYVSKIMQEGLEKSEVGVNDAGGKGLQ